MIKASFLIKHTTSKTSIPSSRYSSSKSQAMHSCPLVDSFVKQKMPKKLGQRSDRGGRGESSPFIMRLSTIQPQLPLTVRAEGRQCHRQLPDTDSHPRSFTQLNKTKAPLHLYMEKKKWLVIGFFLLKRKKNRLADQR